MDSYFWVAIAAGTSLGIFIIWMWRGRGQGEPSRSRLEEDTRVIEASVDGGTAIDKQ
jgi:hypothetical protein